MWTMNFHIFQLVLEKEPEIKLPTSTGSSKRQENSRKTSTSAWLTMPKPLIVCITTHCRKFFKRWEYETTWSGSWEICMQVSKQQLELDMEQQTISKLGKEHVKIVCCHSTYLTYMQSERKWKSVVPNSLQPHGRYSPWNSPGQNTRVSSLSFSRRSSQPRDQTQVDSLPAKPQGKPMQNAGLNEA